MFNHVIPFQRITLLAAWLQEASQFYVLVLLDISPWFQSNSVLKEETTFLPPLGLTWPEMPSYTLSANVA